MITYYKIWFKIVKTELSPLEPNSSFVCLQVTMSKKRHVMHTLSDYIAQLLESKRVHASITDMSSLKTETNKVIITVW